MEMLPELEHPKQRPRGDLGETLTASESLSTCCQFWSQFNTERIEKLDCIVCIVSDIWRQILYNWSVSHINHFIAGPIEEIIGSGTASAREMKTITEAAVAADAEPTPNIVHNVREQPVCSGLTQSGLELKSVDNVWRKGQGLDSKNGEISGIGLDVLMCEGGHATRTIEVIMSLVKVEMVWNALGASSEWEHVQLVIGESSVITQLRLGRGQRLKKLKEYQKMLHNYLWCGQTESSLSGSNACCKNVENDVRNAGLLVSRLSADRKS